MENGGDFDRIFVITRHNNSKQKMEQNLPEYIWDQLATTVRG